MVLFVYLFYSAFFIASVLCEGCDRHGILIYEDLACTPQYEKNNECPVKYDCKGIESDGNNCYFKGKSYKDREHVESALSNPSCDEGCFCVADGKTSSFTCAILDCPEWLGSPVKEGCYRNYSLNHCCSTGEICPPFDKNGKCVVDGKEYREGEKFYPNNTCLNCVCLKGFQGKFEEPFCQRRSCGQQLRRSGEYIQRSCAPFYSKQLHNDVLCCPDYWICPNGSENIEGDAKSEQTCQYGDQTLKVGQYFERVNISDNYGRNFKKVKCECVVPPFAKCVDVDT